MPQLIKVKNVYSTVDSAYRNCWSHWCLPWQLSTILLYWSTWKAPGLLQLGPSLIECRWAQAMYVLPLHNKYTVNIFVSFIISCFAILESTRKRREDEEKKKYSFWSPRVTYITTYPCYVLFTLLFISCIERKRTLFVIIN